MSLKKSIVKNLKLLILPILFIFISLFSGCATIRKETNFKGSYECDYNSDLDLTYITWQGNFQNESIYDASETTIKFILYKDNDVIYQDKETTLKVYISHGSNKNYSDTFYVKGEINRVEYHSLSFKYENIWTSYIGWWIGTIIVVAIALIVSILYKVFDWDWDWDFEDAAGWVWSLIIILILSGIGISAITGWMSSNWVAICIVIGGIIACLAIVGIVCLVAYLIEECWFDKDETSKKKSKKQALQTSKTELSVEDLKLYCKENGIKGYSKLNKQELEQIVDDHKNGIEVGNLKIQNNKSKITFKDIAGLEKAKQAFKEKIIMPIEHPDLYKKYGKKIGGGILLYGLPGTGKTMFAEAASNEIDATFISLKCSDIKSKWYGESERKVKEIFKKAKKSERAIIFFDEFEAIGSKRNEESGDGNNSLVPEILAEMQGVGSKNGNSKIIVIAATNRPWMIDSAFLRPGRFDEKICIPLPDETARKTLFELKLKSVPSKDLDFNVLAQITEGFNGADINEFCEKLKMIAINENIKNGSEYLISMEDVKNVSKIIKSSVSKQDIEELKNFEENNS